MFTHRQSPARELMMHDFAERALSSDRESCTLEKAERQMRTWKELGKYAVFTAGAYDLLSINHVRGLVQCRMIGAMSLLGMGSVNSEGDFLRMHELASSDRIRLMLSVDTNRALAESKSRRPEKGNAPKPTLDWETRAVMLSAQSMPLPGYDQRRALVDYITKHGPDCCDICLPGTCVNEDDARMVVSLQPDLVVVNTGSRQTIADLTRYKTEGQLPATELVTIDESEGAFSDPILQTTVSTTSIISRIRS